MAIKYKLPDTAYTPGGITILKAATEAEARAEYTRLRKAANKRLARFVGTKYEESEVYQYRTKRPFKKPSEIKKLSDLQAALSDVKGFLDAKSSSVTGQKKIEKKILKTLHENQYTFVTAENLKDFGHFMEAARAKAGGKLKGSDRVAEMYDAAVRKKIPPEELLKDFEYWLRNTDELNRSRISRVKGASSETYKRNIERRKKAKKR